MEPTKKGTKVIGISGDLKKGNAEYLLEVALSAASKAGSETELVLLREKDIKHRPKGEKICTKEMECDVQDYIQDIMASLVSAHAVIFASPVIEGQAPKLLLDFMNRMHSVETTGLLANKRAAIIVCAEKTLRSAKTVASTLENFCRNQGMVVEKIITGIAEEPSGIREQKDLIGASMVLGRKMFSEWSTHKKHG